MVITRLVGGVKHTRSSNKGTHFLERARYVYNDQVEFFYENFKADILALSLDKS